MPRPRKLTTEQIKQAAADRRSGMTWRELREKYACAVNTLRDSLAKYSDEFIPTPPPQRSELKNDITAAQSEIEKIKVALRKRFNLHI